MALDADTLLDRIRLKQTISRWQALAIGSLILLLIVLANQTTTISALKGKHIAHLRIEGVIADESERQKLLKKIADNESIQAVIVTMDTPGGTAVGGESLYLGLKKIAKEKPVVIMMRTVCTSAGYMAALAGDHILAREGTITGSIGVIMQTVEMTSLAEKLGIQPITIKSGTHKATPNPMEKLAPSQRQVIEAVVQDFYRHFISLVAEGRKMDMKTVRKLADGRVYTGRQALDNGLIDAIGGEDEAREWLETNHQITHDTPMHDYKAKRPIDGWWGQIKEFTQFPLFSVTKMPATLDGLTLIWHASPQ